MSSPSHNEKDAANLQVLRTLDRGLALLEVLASNAEGATVTHLADALTLNITTCYHLVNTLVARGYVAKGRDRRIRLGPAVGPLYAAYARQTRPERALLLILETLSSITSETTYLSTWESGEVVLRSVVEGPQHLRVSGLSPGLRGSLHARATGKVMLAYLSENELDLFLLTHELTPVTIHTITDPAVLREHLVMVARQGFAEDYEEFSSGVYAVAAPYFDVLGRATGALAVSMPLGRHELNGAAALRAVLAAAEEASRLLGHAGPYPPEHSGRA